MKILLLAAFAASLAIPAAAQPTSSLSPNNQDRVEQPRSREGARQDRIQRLRDEERRAGFPSNRGGGHTVVARNTSHASHVTSHRHRQRVCTMRHHHRVCRWR